MRQVYQALLHLYPAEHRAVFAPEMLGTFEQASARRRELGLGAYMRFAVGELTGLVSGALREWSLKTTTQGEYISVRCLPQRESTLPVEVVELRKQVQLLIGYLEFAISHHDFRKARLYAYEEQIARERLNRLLDPGGSEGG